MAYEVKILADSISPAGARITTYQLRFPRFILAEFNTHRAISKNARSSRAVPVEKMLDEVARDHFAPVFWGANQKGMQSSREIHPERKDEVRSAWWCARNDAMRWAKRLVDCGVHKQIANRLLEPFLWVDVVATATSPGWMNFFSLRCHEAAQPEMQVLAVRMARAYRDSKPIALDYHEWHTPYVGAGEYPDIQDRLCVSVARCARVSYRAFDGEATTIFNDISLHDRLEENGHWSPFEHQAQPLALAWERSGNFVGFEQYRQGLARSVHTEFDFSSLDRFGDRDFLV